ncbi:MAG: MAPEG family protein, partial [Allosphingosinicella sp.]
MHTELTILAWGCVLALVHIFAAVRVKTRQYGTAWNMGARDEALPPPEPMVGRLARAQANYFETFPIAAAAILVVSLAGLTSRWTE